MNNLSPMMPYNGFSAAADSLADGLNHIAKIGNLAAMKASSDRGLDSGSLYHEQQMAALQQQHGSENIPMRSLLFNGRKIASKDPPLFE